MQREHNLFGVVNDLPAKNNFEKHETKRGCTQIKVNFAVFIGLWKSGGKSHQDCVNSIYIHIDFLQTTTTTIIVGAICRK